MTEAPENSPFSTIIAGLEAMFPVTQAALAIYISQLLENILARISQIDHNFTHLGRRFWAKNQYIAAVLGLAEAVKRGRADGVPVIGICGGYQMLGQRIFDPDNVESVAKETAGLGLLPLDTVFEGDKATHQVKGTVKARVGLLQGYDGGDVVGYEIHMGRSTGEAANGLLEISERSGRAVAACDGASDVEGLTLGTYMHGLFHNHGLRRTVLLNLARRKGVSLPEGAALDLDGEYDKLADHIRQHVDMDVIYRMAGLR